MIKAAIIDDEPSMQLVNSNLLSECFPDIKQVGTANSVESGYDLIVKKKPNLVLLDIELIDGTGFQLLQKLKPYNFKVIFITKFDFYARKAIKFSALDYILKPVNETEFKYAIQRAIERIEAKESTQSRVDLLMESYKKETQSKKLALKTSDSLHIIDISDIYFCKSNNN